MKKSLAIILTAGAILRLVGIQYGLPLWVVSDEPSSIFGALKMLELRTLLPVLHQQEFLHVLYYTPYLSFLYLPSFVVLIVIKWLFFAGDAVQFRANLIMNVDSFFLIARVYSALLGVATIWLVYSMAQNLFKKHAIAIATALFMTFSFLSVNFSHWARHWTPVTALFAFAMYVLSHPDWSVPKRYIFLALTAGIGIGINLQVGFVLIYAFLWVFLVDKLRIIQIVKSRWFWQSIMIFFVGSVVAYLIWPNGFGFLGLLKNVAPAAVSNKSISGFFLSYWFYILSFIKAEPVLLAAFIAGSIALFRHARSIVGVVWSFIIFYIATFFFVFSTTDRFILVVYPLVAMVAGYGLATVYGWIAARNTRIARVIYVTVVVFLIIPVARFDYLLYKNDTRVQAIDWTEANIPAGSKVVVFAPLMRLSTTAEALREQKDIDPLSLRSIDQVEMSLNDKLALGRKYHALNLFNIKNESFSNNLSEYINKNNYQYIIYSSFFTRDKGAVFLDNLSGERIKFNGSWGTLLSSGHDRIPDGFGEGYKELFSVSNFGPDIQIIKLF